MKLSIPRSLTILATLFLISTAALAQYVWLDENGKKQFSDSPPPASVPKNKILKSPNKPLTNSASPSATEDKAKQPESLAEKEVAYKKHQEEVKTKQAKETEEAKAAAARADTCKSMQVYKQTLDSGQRITQTDANGARSYMSDEQRVQEQNDLHQKMSDCTN